ncbi:MAG: hypothetical protein K2N15_08975 [Lachnospiraceae bacterium]|nr:hypothetical protein [Lachnospiraceae bacterium]
MAYGIYCSVCGGTVDNNEFDFVKDMCKECVSEQELEETGLKNAEHENIVTEV